MTGNESSEDQLTIEALGRQAFELARGIFQKHCPEALEELNRKVGVFVSKGSNSKDRRSVVMRAQGLVSETPRSNDRILGLEPFLSVLIPHDVASDLDIAPEVFLTLTAALSEDSGFPTGIFYYTIDMYTTNSSDEDDSESTLQLFVCKSTMANEQGRVSLTDEGSGFYDITDSLSHRRLRHITHPLAEEDIPWVKALIDAIAEADKQGGEVQVLED